MSATTKPDIVSGAKRSQVLEVAPDIVRGCGLILAAGFEEAVELVARLDAERETQFVGGQRAGLVGGECESLQCLAVERRTRPTEAHGKVGGMCTSKVWVSGIGVTPGIDTNQPPCPRASSYI